MLSTCAYCLGCCIIDREASTLDALRLCWIWPNRRRELLEKLPGDDGLPGLPLPPDKLIQETKARLLAA
jgi:hypothetical protein